jgi:hypothetical protein
VSFKRTDFCNSRKTFRKPGGGSERNDEDANRGWSFRLRDGDRGVSDGHDFLHLHPREVRTVRRLYFNIGFFFKRQVLAEAGALWGQVAQECRSWRRVFAVPTVDFDHSRLKNSAKRKSKSQQ